MNEALRIEYRDWDEYRSTIVRELFADEAFSRGRFLFRGQGLADWPLRTGFDRWYNDTGRTGSRLQAARDLLHHFRKAAEGLDIDDALWGDESRAAALAQHHGLPTRLLDWSESPYVAAFFAFNSAFENRRAKEAVAIWVIDTRSAVWSGDFGVKIVRVTSVGNVRLRHQAGQFTLSATPFDTLDEYLLHCQPRDGYVPLRKILIPAGSAAHALSELDAMGLHHATIYPGLEGCALAAKVRMTLGLDLK